MPPRTRKTPTTLAAPMPEPDPIDARASGHSTATSSPSPAKATRRGKTEPTSSAPAKSTRRAAGSTPEAVAPEPVADLADEPEAEDEKRKSRTFYLTTKWVERGKAAAYATGREPGEAWNLSELVENALRKEVERLEAKYNDGQPFPPITRLRVGPSPEAAVRAAELRSRDG